MKNDEQLLAEAYLSIGKPMQSVPSDDVEMSTEPNDVVSTEPVSEPVETTVMTPELEPACSCQDGEHEEAIDMAINNLNSIRESITKIASFCATGEPLEAWAQQKLAVAMDNLAGVARSLGVPCHGG